LPAHVAIYLHTLFNGGIERVIFDLMAEIVARQIEVDLVVNTLDFSPMQQELPKDVSLVNLRCAGFASRLPRLIGYLRHRQPSCLLSAGHLANEVAILAKMLSLSKMRVVVSEQTNLSSELSALPATSVRRLAIPPIGRMIYRFADGVVAVSEAVRLD
jgi:hypothetical protein